MTAEAIRARHARRPGGRHAPQHQRSRLLAIWSMALAPIFGMALVTLAGSSASASTTPGWEPDPNQIGYVAFADSSGNLKTSGNLSDHPFAAYAVASQAGRSGDTIAQLYASTPQVGTNPQTWNSDLLFSSTYNPAPSGTPSTVGVGGLPFATGPSSGDLSMSDYIGEFPNTSTTAGYQNLYELRIYTAGPGQPADTTQYDRVDIQVDTTAGTWTVVYPPESLQGIPGASPTPTPTDTSPTPTPTDTSPTPTPTDTSPTPTPTDTSPTPTPTDTSPTPTPTYTSPTPTPTRTTVDVVATNSSGQQLPNDPLLQPGQSVTIAVSGFDAGETVGATMHSTPVQLTAATADGNGNISYGFTVPSSATAGNHSVVFAGQTSGVHATWNFRVASSTGTTSSSGGTTAGSLPFTGSNTARMTMFGLAALWSGLVLFVAGRRGSVVRPTGRHRRAS